MKVSVLKAIGATQNMSISEIQSKWSIAPVSITAQCPDFGVAIGSVSKLQDSASAAINAITAAQKALTDVMMFIPGFGAANAAVEASKVVATAAIDEFNNAQSSLIKSALNTEVEV